MSVLRLREMYNDAGLTLLAVETVTVQRSAAGGFGYCSGNLQPVAIIVSTRAQRYALDMNAQPIQLGQLVRDLPELAGWL